MCLQLTDLYFYISLYFWFREEWFVKKLENLNPDALGPLSLGNRLHHNTIYLLSSLFLWVLGSTDIKVLKMLNLTLVKKFSSFLYFSH